VGRALLELGLAQAAVAHLLAARDFAGALRALEAAAAPTTAVGLNPTAPTASAVATRARSTAMAPAATTPAATAPAARVAPTVAVRTPPLPTAATEAAARVPAASVSRTLPTAATAPARQRHADAVTDSYRDVLERARDHHPRPFLPPEHNHTWVMEGEPEPGVTGPRRGLQIGASIFDGASPLEACPGIVADGCSGSHPGHRRGGDETR
jgi:hypothetical protein